MKNKRIILGIGVTACLALSITLFWKNHGSGNLADQALLSIIKNDQKSFENFIASGGKLDLQVEVEGKNYKVGDLLVKYERINFIKYLSEKNIAFGSDVSAEDDMWSLAVSKNNSELLSTLMKSYPAYKLNSKKYGADQRNLLHLASVYCSHKVVGILDNAGMNWNDKDKKGATPLTIAAENDCLQVLSYWKEHGADFKSKDGRGMTALSILSKKKDAALVAFAESFLERRAPASVATVAEAPAIPNFYKKRVIPKDNLADRADLIEPGDRPDDANETAENSEFSD